MYLDVKLLHLIYYALTGIIAGISAGLLGIGGGLIIVPLLLLGFTWDPPANPEIFIHVAIATSLASILFTSLSTIYAQQQKKAITWNLVIQLLPGILLGAFVGGIITTYLSQNLLILFFSLFLYIIAWKMWFYGRNPLADSHNQSKKSILPPFFYEAFMLYPVSLFIGIISSILGIGGGTMTVPYLSQGYQKGHLGIKKAVAVSSVLGFPIALAGSMGFMWQAWQQHLHIYHGLGYIYLPALVPVSLFAFVSARLGVRLLHQWETDRIARIFAVIILIQASKLFLSLLFNY